MTEKRTPAEWVVNRINSLGGFNRYDEPNFRVIWGGNRFHKVGGMFKHVTFVNGPIIGSKIPVVTEVADLRDMLAYHPERWHLERWRGPEFYGSREDWYEQTWDEEAQLHRMGDYPEKGDYEHVFYLAECPHMKPEDTEWCKLCQVTYGQYIPLEENVHILEQQIRALLLSDGVNRNEEQRALFLREDQKRQEKRKYITERVMGAMRPKLATQPTSWQPGMGARCSVPEAKLPTHLTLPVGKRKDLGFSQIQVKEKE